MKTEILGAIEFPKKLEDLYRTDPNEFERAFADVFAEHPESVVLQIWNERINFASNAESPSKQSTWSIQNIFTLIFLSGFVWAIYKIPTFIPKIDWLLYRYPAYTLNAYNYGAQFMARNAAMALALAIMIYFALGSNHTRKALIAIAIGAIATILYMNLLARGIPLDNYSYYSKHQAFKDAITLAEIHAPLFLWLLTGVMFAGRSWKHSSSRLDFLRYNGELIVYSTITLLSVLLLSVISVALLDMVDNSYDLTEWYAENILLFGAVASPIIATFLIDKVIGRRLNIAPVLGKIFTPLFLLTTIGYIIVMVVYKKSPYEDRDFLTAFNALLVIVLGLSIFSIAERGSKREIDFSDYMNMGLIFMTLAIDAVALSAVIFRTGDVYGFTPDKIAVLGINTIVFFHLAGVLYYYFRFAFKKEPVAKLEGWLTGYLPVYAVWAVAVTIALPLIFWNQ